MNKESKKLEPTVLIEGNHPEYYGKYVAMPDFNERKVVAYDEDPHKVFEEAQEKGYDNPLILYSPRPGETFIYNIV